MSAERAIAVTLRNRLDEIGRLAEIVDGFAAEHRLSPDVAFHINLAFDEVITNVISYGYDDGLDHEILTSLALDESGGIVIQVADDGRPFNPLEAPPADLDADPLERPVGGLGVHIVRNVMDSLEYRYEGGRNILVMRKAAAPPT